MHKEFKELTFEQIQTMFNCSDKNPNVIIDVKGTLEKDKFKEPRYIYWRL